MDAWEGSCPAGEEDWWAFIEFITIPTQEWAEVNIRFYYQLSTFFDQSHEVIIDIEQKDLPDFDDDPDSEYSEYPEMNYNRLLSANIEYEDDGLDNAWEYLFRILVNVFDAKEINEISLNED